MECRTFNARSAKLYGIEDRRRRNASRTPDGEFDCAENGLLFLGGIFIGDCPTWCFCSCAELRALRKIVDLDNGTVNIIGEFSPPCTNFRNCFPDLIRCTADAVIGDDLNPLRPHKLVCLCMRGKTMPLSTLQIEYKHGEFALSCYAGIQLTQCTSRTITWICKQLQTEQLLPFVHLCKRSTLHIDLAAHFKIRQRFMQFIDNIADGACVQRDILSLYCAVAACNGTGEYAVLVAQCK